eukprot:scaffold39532_cov66-Phaeocystis_antarctica.AAC.4
MHARCTRTAHAPHRRGALHPHLLAGRGAKADGGVCHAAARDARRHRQGGGGAQAGGRAVGGAPGQEGGAAGRRARGGARAQVGRVRGEPRRAREAQGADALPALLLPRARRVARVHQAQGQADDDGAAQPALPPRLPHLRRAHGAARAHAPPRRPRLRRLPRRNRPAAARRRRAHRHPGRALARRVRGDLPAQGRQEGGAGPLPRRRRAVRRGDHRRAAATEAGRAREDAARRHARGAADPHRSRPHLTALTGLEARERGQARPQAGTAPRRSNLVVGFAATEC